MPHMACGPVEKIVALFGWNAKQFADDDERNGCGVGWDEIKRTISWKPVDQFMRECLDPGTQPLDGARDEGAIDQRAQPRVGGRLQFQQRTAFDLIETRKMFAPGNGIERCSPAVFPSEPLVAEQPVDVVKTAEAPDAVIVPEKR